MLQKPKGESRIDTPETRTTLHTRHINTSKIKYEQHGPHNTSRGKRGDQSVHERQGLSVSYKANNGLYMHDLIY